MEGAKIQSLPIILGKLCCEVACMVLQQRPQDLRWRTRPNGNKDRPLPTDAGLPCRRPFSQESGNIGRSEREDACANIGGTPASSWETGGS